MPAQPGCPWAAEDDKRFSPCSLGWTQQRELLQQPASAASPGVCAAGAAPRSWFTSLPILVSPLAFSFCVLLAAGLCCLLPPAGLCPQLLQSRSWSHRQVCAHSSCKVTLGRPESPAPLCSTHRAAPRARLAASARSFLLPASVMSPCSFGSRRCRTQLGVPLWWWGGVAVAHLQVHLVLLRTCSPLTVGSP